MSSPLISFLWVSGPTDDKEFKPSSEEQKHASRMQRHPRSIDDSPVEKVNSQSRWGPSGRQEAMAHHRKRRSVHDNMLLHPDPFRYGNPNPLGSHPILNLNRSGNNNLQKPNGRKQPSQSMSPGIGSKHTTLYNKSDVEHASTALPSLDPSPKSSVGADSLESLYEFFQSNSLSRTLATVPNLAADRISAPSPARLNADIELEEFVIDHEAPTPTRKGKGQRSTRMYLDEVIEVEEFVNSHEINMLQQATNEGEAVSPLKIEKKDSSTPQKIQMWEGSNNTNEPTRAGSLLWSTETRGSFASRVQGDEIQYFIPSGLPRGWTAEHDRFIAYLDTHAPLDSRGRTPRREWEIERYDLEETVNLLKELFEDFRGKPIPDWAIQRRLEVLDLRDNDYFNQPYSAYVARPWGERI